MVALVVRARRETLLRAHSRRLRREDLEDCFGQAALELVVRARQGMPFRSRAHIAHVLEQRFLSRIYDRRRALSGRSDAQTTFEHALAAGLFSDDEPQVADPRAEIEQIVELRLELARLRLLASQLTPDQRLVLACQVSLQWGSDEFCARFGWSREKYRKVAQRARARLKRLAAA
jgi:DNA-directed RNA polymerase specialized sigma24 family protein